MPYGLYYKHITIVNDDSRVNRMTLQDVATPRIVILTTLETHTIVILITLQNTYSTRITYDRKNIFKVQATGVNE
jgi:hypothetical protein